MTGHFEHLDRKWKKIIIKYFLKRDINNVLVGGDNHFSYGDDDDVVDKEKKDDGGKRNVGRGKTAMIVI